MSNPTKNRMFSLDLIRLVAILAVVMIHVSADFVKENSATSFDFIMGNAFNSLSRLAVPLFLMISGSLMLRESKDIPPKKMLRTALSFGMILVFWSALYAVSYHIIKPLVFGEAISLQATALAFLKGHYHLWYLYVLIGLYIMTPILRLFVKKENKVYIKWYLVLSLVVSFCTPLVNFILNVCGVYPDIYSEFIGQFGIALVGAYLAYYVLGWYIAEIGIEKKLRPILYASGAAGLVATFTLVQFFPQEEFSNTIYSTSTINVFLYSVAVYVFLYYSFENTKETKLTCAVSGLSKYIFGVYLIHPVFLFALKLIGSKIPSPLAELSLCFLGATLLSFATVFVISKIPLLKKSIRC